mmetsp:Transcript_58433/g.139405  ORF Transcript_58433/g.139405 Transcript_58433/m.139405 type:complete len:847 (-) Transcript_58433:143-2683(-)
MEKCKQLVNGLVNGSVTPQAVFQMSGGAAAAPGATPGGAVSSATTPELGKDLLPDSLASAPSVNPLDGLGASPAVGLPGAAAGLTPGALPGAAAGLPGAAAALPGGAAGLAGLGLPGAGLSLPGNGPAGAGPLGLPGAAGAAPPRTGATGMLTRGEAQVQQDINEYYAQWWQQYATTVIPRAGQAAAESNAEEPSKAGGGAAFDREALARLAAQAAKTQEGAATSQPMPAGAFSVQLPTAPKAQGSAGGMPVVAAAQARRQVDDEDMELDEPAPSKPSQKTAQAMPTPVMLQEMPGLQASKPPPQAQQMPTSPAMPKKEAGFTSFGLATTGPKILKDNDSVQKMVERLQGNVQQTKLPTAAQPPAPARPGFDPATQVSVTAATYRAPTDPELAALAQKIQKISTASEAQAFGADIVGRLGSFTAEQIADLLNKMDGLTDLHTAEFLGDLSKALTPRLGDFTSTQFSSLMSVFMLWSLDAVPPAKRKSRTPARGSGSLPELCRAFFTAAASEMSLRLMEFAPHELNCCMAAFVAVGFIEYKLFTSVGRAVLARHGSFGSQQLAALLSLLSELRLVHLDLLHAVGQFVATRVKEVRRLDTLRVLRAFAKCNVRHDALCQAVGNEIVERIQEKGADSGWKVEDLCEVAWVFCVLQTYHEPLFRLMLKQLEQTPKVATDALCMLYECHLVLDSEHKEAYAKYRIEHDKAQALLDHYKEHRKDSRRCSETQRSEVASVLKTLVEGSVHVAHRTSTGLLVDVAALRKKTSSDGFIHIEMDSPMTVVRPLDQDEAAAPSLIMEGPVALKRRLLQKHGLHVITVRESEWRELADSRDRKRHLRSLLSSLSDILE